LTFNLRILNEFIDLTPRIIIYADRTLYQILRPKTLDFGDSSNTNLI